VSITYCSFCSHDLKFCIAYIVGSNGPSYKLARCLAHTDSSCFDQIIIRVRRNASKAMDVATIPTAASHPHLSSTANVSLEFAADQSNVSSTQNASLHSSSEELLPNFTSLPAEVTDSVTTPILDILEVSIYFKRYRMFISVHLCAFLYCCCIFRLHRMHEMQTIVTDVSNVCLSVCLSVCRKFTK